MGTTDRKLSILKTILKNDGAINDRIMLMNIITLEERKCHCEYTYDMFHGISGDERLQSRIPFNEG